MATRVTEDARQERHEKERLSFSSRSAPLVWHFSRLRRSRARALLSLNLKKKRDCSQSTNRIGVHTLPNSFRVGMKSYLVACEHAFVSLAQIGELTLLVECEHYLKVAIEGFHF